MQHLRKLVLIASILCLGLSPALAMNHGGGEYMGGLRRRLWWLRQLVHSAKYR